MVVIFYGMEFAYHPLQGQIQKNGLPDKQLDDKPKTCIRKRNKGPVG